MYFSLDGIPVHPTQGFPLALNLAVHIYTHGGERHCES